jgi:hypothetical protein
MSQKFSIVIEVKNGKPVATGYIKAEANLAVAHFVKLREAGIEAYLFQHPIADRRSKSTAQVNATLGLRDAEGHVQAPPDAPKAPIPEHKKSEIVSPVKPKRKGNKLDMPSEPINLDDPSAVDLG